MHIMVILVGTMLCYSASKSSSTTPVEDASHTETTTSVPPKKPEVVLGGSHDDDDDDDDDETRGRTEESSVKASEATTSANSSGVFEDMETTLTWIGTTEDKEEEVPLWRTVLELLLFVMALLGYFANMVTLVSLVRHGKFVNPKICLLLKHQSLMDAGVCLMAAILVMQPSMWLTGLLWVDAAVCILWHTQEIYWFTVLVSVWNLVLISGERFLAVCKPFTHAKLNLKKVRLAIFLLYPFCLVNTSLSMAQCKFDFDTDQCLSEFVIPGKLGEDVMYVFAIVTLFSFHIIPIILYVVIYGRIIYTLKMRTKNTELAASKVIETASEAMTKAAIALTIIFFFSIGFDSWYYPLGYTGVVPYVTNSPLQKISAFLAVFNSCVNPCVYAVLMPAYRRSVKMTFCCCVGQQHGTSDVTSSGGQQQGTSGVPSTGVSSVSTLSAVNIKTE